VFPQSNVADPESYWTEWIDLYVNKRMVVYDIGANRGTLSRMFSNRGATIVAVEGFPVHLEELASVLPSPPHYIVIAAAWDCCTPLRVTPTLGSGQIEISPELLPDCNDLSTIPSSFYVQGTTLASLARKAKLPWPNVMKLDIQGSEVQALEGARGILGDCETIFCEHYEPSLLRHGHTNADLEALLDQLGYAEAAEAGHDKVWRKK